MKIEYFSVEEAGDKLGITRQRVDKLMREGRIEYETVGKTRIISDKAIENFRKEREK